ncbi:ABC transporter permease [Pedobacter sp. PWIIR3]
MSPFKISWKSVWSKPLSSALNILLISFGTAILTILLLASTQISNKLENNSKDIDLVVGAKGSPLQLILSSIYYIDFPTGNIPLKEAMELAHSPFVKRAVPLALGDNYNGTRIVGTDSNFVSVYKLTVGSGKFWNQDFQTTIGSNVAKIQNLKVGDKFYGAHGLSGSTDVHRDHQYVVTGILTSQDNVTDNLILTNVASVWKMHGDDHGDADEKELTSLLIQYRSPMSVVMFPRLVNGSTNMQAAAPAQESTRLFSLIGVGIDTLQWFAILIMIIATISVFVNLYNSLKERSYDLAIMRILGASKFKLFRIVIIEGVLLTVIGTIIGLFLGHLVMETIGAFQESTQARLTGIIFLNSECWLIASGMIIGIIASLIPALQAYRTDISKILAKNN